MNAQFIAPAITVMDCQEKFVPEDQGRVYDHLIHGGIDGIVILGSIGEFTSMTMEKKKEVVRFAVEYINKRTKLIVGTTSMVYEEIIELSEYALSLGADAVIVIPPYYFWLQDRNIEDYYDRIADAVHGKIYLYNFPDRTGYSISPQTVLNLRRRHENIVGLKDTLGGVDHTREVIKLVKPEFPDFEIFSGFDDNFARNVMMGGDGCIGGLSNIYPLLFHKWVLAFRENDLTTVSRIQQKVDRLMDVYSVGSPFIPYIKTAVSLRLNGIHANAAFPFPKVTAEEEEKVRLLMNEFERTPEL